MINFLLVLLTNLDTTVTVAFNANGGILENNNKVYHYNDKLGELPTPKNGLNYFVGWYLDSDFNTLVDNNYMVTDNIILYAKWYKYVNLSLDKRVLSNPSSVSYSKNTNRIFNINTYVVGISPDNYYYNSNVINYNYNPPNFNISVAKDATGYGVGIPISITANKYYFSGTTNDIFSFSFYKSNGEFISYKYLFNTNQIFEVPESANIMLLNMRGNEKITPTTFSNPTLYIVE